MSDNRFSYCLTADEVLGEYLCRMDANPATRADAVARIAELTRTVTAEQRARVEEIVSDRGTWRVVLHGEFHAVADRIIDALGYQAEPAHDNDDDQCKPSCHCQPDPPAPVVELDADQLRNIANILDAAMSMRPVTNPGRSHPNCWGDAGHVCQQPSGRTCIECCSLPAGTLWGPYWCPDCDVARLDRIASQLATIGGDQ